MRRLWKHLSVVALALFMGINTLALVVDSGSETPEDVSEPSAYIYRAPEPREFEIQETASPAPAPVFTGQPVLPEPEEQELEPPAGEPAQAPIEEPAEDPAQELLEEPSEEPMQEPAEEPAQDKPGYINADGGVRLRAENNTGSAVLASLSKGAVLTVTGDGDGEWYPVIYLDTSGYVFAEYVTLGNPPEEQAPAAVPVPAEEQKPVQTPPQPAQAPAEPEPAQTAAVQDSIEPSAEPEEQAPDGTAGPEPGEPADQPGYINGDSVRLRAGNSTDSEILSTLRWGTSLTVTGQEGDWYSVVCGGKNGYVFAQYVTIGETAVPEPGENGVELVDWWLEGKSIMKIGVKAILTDVATGISFQIRAMSSGNHADVEPLTADDTAAILRIRGKFSWTQRASLLTVNGRTIAVSVNGMPHAGGTISGNNFDGHFCTHFLNSRNHYNNSVDPEHQRQVMIAYNS